MEAPRAGSALVIARIRIDRTGVVLDAEGMGEAGRGPPVARPVPWSTDAIADGRWIYPGALNRCGSTLPSAASGA
jgi:hypothetical protein